MSFLSDLSLRFEDGRKILGTGALMVAALMSPIAGFSPVSSILARNMLCMTFDFVSDTDGALGALKFVPDFTSSTSDFMR